MFFITSNLIKTQSGEIIELDKLFKLREKVVVEVPISYNLAARSNLIKKVDGSIVDFVESVIQGREVLAENIPVSYNLAPQSDIISLLNGEKVSFIETLISGLNIIPQNRLFKNLVYGSNELTGGYFHANGTIVSDTIFRRRFIPVVHGKQYRMKGSFLSSMTGFFAYFDENKQRINSLSSGGRWSDIITDSSGLQFRETNAIPLEVHYIGMSYNFNAGHGKNLMIWENGLNPGANDYVENCCYY